MRRFVLPIRSVSNVGASKTALIEVPIGLRLHTLTIHHGYASGTNTVAAAATNVSEIRVKVNGTVRRKFSGTELRDLNLLHGTQYDFQGVPNTDPGVAMAIHFAEPWRKDVVGQNFGALPTQWTTGRLTTLQVEVDLGAASTPTLVAFGQFDDAVPDIGNLPSPIITEVQSLSVAAAGTSFDITTLDRKGILLQLSLYPDSGASQQATRLTLRKNGTVLHEITKAGLFAVNSGNDMFPTASGRSSSISDLVLDANDVQGNGEDLSDARELSLTVEAASAMSGTLKTIIQRQVPVI